MTPRSLSVPTWGFCCHATSGGAPCESSVCFTKAHKGSWMRVVSLPSENVPAPPSPNWMFASGCKTPVCSKAFTAAARFSMAGPRSSTRGAKPACASTSAANSPAGPSPHTTGLAASGAAPRGMVNGRGLANETEGAKPS